MPEERDYKTTALRMPTATFDVLHVIADLEGTSVA